MLNKDFDVYITRHCRDRANEFNIRYQKLLDLFWDSVEEDKPPGCRNLDDGKITLYRRNGPYVMVVGLVKHKETRKPLYLLLTVYDQRLDLPAKFL